MERREREHFVYVDRPFAAELNADLADFYPAAQTVPQTVNGTQPVVPRTAAPAGYAAGGGVGSPALWVLIICAAGILLLHAGE